MIRDFVGVTHRHVDRDRSGHAEGTLDHRADLLDDLSELLSKLTHTARLSAAATVPAARVRSAAPAAGGSGVAGAWVGAPDRSLPSAASGHGAR